MDFRAFVTVAEPETPIYNALYEEFMRRLYVSYPQRHVMGSA